MCVRVRVCVHRALGRRAGTWNAGGFQAEGPPVGQAERACQPASSDTTVGSGSSAERLRACQRSPLSGPGGDTETKQELGRRTTML